jgi:hypothetical protein
MGGAILSRALTVGKGASAAGRTIARGATGGAENEFDEDGRDDEGDDEDDGGEDGDDDDGDVRPPPR